MKKSIWIFLTFVSLVLVFSFLHAQDNSARNYGFIILGYEAYGNDVHVFSGGVDQKPIPCKGKDVSNCVVELLATYRAEGYEVISTTTAPTSYWNTERNGNPGIFIFLEKR